MKETYLQNILNSLGVDNHERIINGNGIKHPITEADTNNKTRMLQLALATYNDKLKSIEYMDAVGHYNPIENTSQAFTSFVYAHEDDGPIPMAVRVGEVQGRYYVQFRIEFEHI